MSKVISFEINLEQHTLKQVDTWRSEQPSQLTQAEAVQRLVEIGLVVARVGKDEVRISVGEKLIMMMLRDLYKHQDVKGQIDPDFVEDALCGGHYWGLELEYPGLLDVDTDDPEIVSETLDILEMWHLIESGYKALSEEDQDRVKKEGEPFRGQVSFYGFDGNHDEHSSVAWFLVNKLERFKSLNLINSHTKATIDLHRRMLQTFKKMRTNLGPDGLGAEQIIALLKPSNNNTSQSS